MTTLVIKNLALISKLRHSPIQNLKKALKLYRLGGWGAIRSKLRMFTPTYSGWIDHYDRLSYKAIKFIENEHLEATPLVSVLMPVFNTEPKFLAQAIQSVKNQLYKNWELIIVNDCSTNRETLKLLEKERDTKIKLFHREKNGGISIATQDALLKASGDWVVLLDHDDVIPPHALYRIVKEARDGVEFIYTDEDKITENGERFYPFFKPDFDPELLVSMNYICHLSAFKRNRLIKVGGFREGFEGAQDWDCVLRYTKELKPNQIKHIPEILYHWRAISTSTAASAEAKPYVFQAQQLAVTEHLPGVDVGYDIDYQHVVATYPSANPLVSVIIPTKDKKALLEVCVNGLVNKTNYKNLEIIIIDNGSTDQEALDYLRSLPQIISYVRVIRDDGPFNFSRLNNRAVREAKGELLLFLNNDIEIVEPEWLTEMVSLAVRPDTGAVGAKLLYPDGRIQHAGVILGIGGVAGHSHKFFQGSDPGYFKRNILRHSVSAVTAACLLIRAELFRKVGGFDEEHLTVAFNDVDFCLKVRELGVRNIYTPYATLVHHESVSRGYEDSPEKIARFNREIKYMQNKWDLKNDPYYNPNLTDVSEDFALAFPPRRHKFLADEG